MRDQNFPDDVILYLPIKSECDTLRHPIGRIAYVCTNEVYCFIANAYCGKSA